MLARWATRRLPFGIWLASPLIATPRPPYMIVILSDCGSLPYVQGDLLCRRALLAAAAVLAFVYCA